MKTRFLSLLGLLLALASARATTPNPGEGGMAFGSWGIQWIGGTNWTGFTPESGNYGYLTNGDFYLKGTFYGNGAGLTNVDGTNITGGPISRVSLTNAPSVTTTQLNVNGSGTFGATTVGTTGITNSTALVLNSTGLGIGKSPTQKIDVNGTAKADYFSGVMQLGGTRFLTGALDYLQWFYNGQSEMGIILGPNLSTLAQLTNWPAINSVNRSNYPAIEFRTAHTTVGAGNFVSIAASNGVFAGFLTPTGGIVLPSTTAYVKWLGVANSNPPTSGSGTAYFFAATNASGVAQIYGMSGDGTISLQTPHALNAPPSLYDDTDEAPLISQEILPFTGKVRWINRSRAARIEEQMLKLQLNAPDHWTFANGKSMAQWSNSAAFGRYTNILTALMGMDQTNKDLLVVESFAEYNTRLGLTNGDGLVKLKWRDVQAGLSNEVWTAFLSATNQYSLDLSNYPLNLSNYLAQVAAGETNLTAPVEPVAPVYVPRASEPVPAWLKKRQVE